MEGGEWRMVGVMKVGEELRGLNGKKGEGWEDGSCM